MTKNVTRWCRDRPAFSRVSSLKCLQKINSKALINNMTWLNYNLGKVNLTLAGQRLSPRHAGLCGVAMQSLRADTASSLGASFFAWQRRARNEWLVMNRKGPWEGYQKRDVWVRGRGWHVFAYFSFALLRFALLCDCCGTLLVTDGDICRFCWT